MKPFTKTLESVRGDYFEMDIRIYSRVWNPLLNGGAGGYERGPARDLTGWTGNFQVRSTADADTVMAQGVVTIQEPQADPDVTGLFKIEILEAEALNLIPGKPLYDIQLRDDLDRPRTPVSGQFIVYADVTRDAP